MAQNMTNFDNMLKEFYEGVARDLLNQETVAFKALNESSREWSGRRVLFPFRSGRNSGVGARAESAALPTAGNQQYQGSIISATYQYGRLQVSGPVLESGKNAFAAAMESEMEGLTMDLIDDLGRQTWNHSQHGRLCVVAATAADAGTTALTVSNRFAKLGHNGARYIYAGQVLDGGTIASNQSWFSAVTVSTVSISKNPATNVDTIFASAGGFSGNTTGTAYLFNRLAGGNEMPGINGLIDDFSATNIYSSTGFMGSSVQNINRGAVAEFNAEILANSGVGRIIDGDLMQEAFDLVDEKSKLPVDIIWGHHSVIRAFLNNVAADRRYGGSGKGGVFDAGHSVLSYNGVELVRDRQASYNQLLVGHRDVLKIYKLSDFKFADQDGSVLSRVSGQDDWEAFLRAYLTLGVDKNIKGLTMIRDIKTDF
jgi:hypothetical protein